MESHEQTALTITEKTPVIYNKTSNLPAIQRGQAGAADYVVHLSTGQVKLLAIVAGQNKRHGARNALLIKFIFDGALRVSEAIAVRRCDIHHNMDGWSVKVMGKGSKPGVVAISPTVAAELVAYYSDMKLLETELIFKVSRSQVFRIVSDAFTRAGIPQPSVENDRVGAVHILRHSGAIERLRQTGNPKAVQDQLRHKSAQMTLKYLKTVSSEESLKIQQGVELW